MSQVKGLKEQIIAGSAIQNLEFFIQWHLTERCNLSCRHCYQGGKRTPEMTVGELKREIDGAAEMFAAWKDEGISVVPSIHFTGGEPFLFRDLWEGIAHARQRGFDAALMSNGILITDEDAGKTRAWDVFDVQISLEGPAPVHDRIRGPGSFRGALRGAKRLIAAGTRVSANVTLSRVNIRNVKETIGIAKDTGFNSIGFSRIVPCGRGRELLDFLLAPEEVRDAYEQAFGLSDAGFSVVSGDPLAGVVRGVRPPADCRLTLSGCSAGFSGVTITSDGTVMACRRIGLKAGNLRKKSLREIWATSPLLWKLRRRESYRGKCGTCDLWPTCRGCRAVSYAFSSARGKADLFADDPQCWLHGRGQDGPSGRHPGKHSNPP
ncbi:MAG TPA: radical SAM protein [Syntrophales bacterium]|jgi:radical SAM protein with 4Fe4S-binding SPASM domain|nr:radical SAM protein [Syntrophales bacterium]HPX55563.1 radical SAM protein [Syntrophales bacterium]HQA81779.1 radical SAM protein [Syntrophales bacterium]